MNITLGQPVFYLITALLAAVLLTWWVYRETTPELSTSKRFLLATLRGLVLFIILFLISEPLFTRNEEKTEQPVLGILIDESQSMSLASGDSTNGASSYREVLNEVKRITDRQQKVLFGFGGGARTLSSVDSVGVTAPRTNISNGLEYVQNESQDLPLGAVLLISDGQHIEGQNPEHIADNYPVPVITVVVGDTTVQQDLRIQQLLSNDLSYVGREVPVRIRIRNEGFRSRPVRLSLSLRGSELDRTTVQLPPPGSEIVTELSFIPDTAGLFQYRISLSRLDGEVTYRNNSEVLSLQILERERRVLLVSGAPSPDGSAFSRMLAEDADTELSTRTQKEAGVYYEGSLGEAISPASGDRELDLIILDGYPTRETTPSDLDAIKRLLDKGTPVLFVVDRSSDLSATQRTLSSYLPVRPRVIRPGFTTGIFVPTARAQRHAVFDIADRRETASWSKLPPIALNQTTWDISAGAIVLARTEVRGLTSDNPVLVLMRSPKTRSAAFLATGFWQWRNVPENFEPSAERWTELFSNLTEWLVARNDNRLVRVAPARSALDESEPVVFGGQVYDENLNPVNDASVSISVRTPSNQIFPYQMQVLGNGRYRADLGSMSEGSYSYTATASRDNGEIGTDSGTFTVGALSIEFRTPYADVALMRQISRRSGGFAISPDDLDQLPERLTSLPSFRPRNVSLQIHLRLWRLLPFLGALLLLMTVEWFLRKRFGLV